MIDQHTHRLFSNIYYIENPSEERSHFISTFEPMITVNLCVFDTADEVISMPRPNLVIIDCEAMDDLDFVRKIKNTFCTSIVDPDIVIALQRFDTGKFVLD